MAAARWGGRISRARIRSWTRRLPGAAYGPRGYPPPGGYPGPGYPPPPAQKPGTNGFAIASLIFGIIGGVLLGFIFGFIALSQTKRTGQNGRGLALAG